MKKYPAGCESNYYYSKKSGIMSGQAFSLLEVKTIDINDDKIDVVKLFNP